MKMSMMSLLILSFILGSIGCDQGSSQNPLKNYSPNVQNSVPAGQQKKVGGKPLSSEFLRIDRSQKYLDVKELETLEVVFTGRILSDKPGAYEIRINNMPEGSSFDSKTGLFSWTPPLGTVKDSEYYKEISIEVEMTSGAAIRKDPLSIFVMRDVSQKPEIREVKTQTIPGDPILEGQSFLLQVKVFIPNGQVDPNNPPFLLFVPNTQAKKDALKYVKTNKVALTPTNDPNIWDGNTYISLDGDIVEGSSNKTVGKKKLGLGILAVSSYAIASDKENFEFEVENVIGEPKLSWLQSSQLKFMQGVSNKFIFTGYDPKDEGNILVSQFTQNCQKLDPDLLCNCDNANVTSSRICYIEWTPKNVGEYTLQFDVINSDGKNQKLAEAPSNSKATKGPFITRKIIVIPGGVSIPTPPPSDPQPPGKTNKNSIKQHNPQAEPQTSKKES